MTDPRREAILIRRRDQSGFDDKTPDVLEHAAGENLTYLTFQVAGGTKTYPYSAQRVLILRNPAREPIGEMDGVSVRGRPVHGLTEVWRFDGPGQTWWRVFSSTGGRESYQTCGQDDFSIVRAAALDADAYDVLHYWQEVVSNLRQNDPLQSLYKSFRTVPQGSVLDLYLRGDSPEAPAGAEEIIFPFSSNLSQREALKKGLTHRISVIDGPPGTGKTQTILNLVANIIRCPGKTVGVGVGAGLRTERDRRRGSDAAPAHPAADRFRA
jgi:hypothetical protein